MGLDEKKKKNNDDDEAETTTAQQSAKKRKRKEVAIFGNYRNYYGYRVGQELEEDPRLKVLKKEWFEGKDCLDIGCNNGTITITIAKKFGCRSILGVDIDGDRIEDAHWNLRKTMKMSTRAVQSKPTKLEDSERMNVVQHHVTEVQSGETSNGKDLSHLVTFQKGNFVKDWWPPEDRFYHTIICLSVAKWIHLNWGDDGLIILFAKIWKLLEPGGILILEPQPWNSYYKNRLVSEMAQTNYHNIKIYPEGFQEVLLDKIGFRMVENISSRLSGSKSGFDRPILAFWK
ncbi:probable RNA methyltransferase At5g51130 [Rhododendron vialii]|uniref:probable RNA methyltransferase At5g51130 n=1 Tax=Rhododendron vialii TaxID=182163 RepID=UPI00265EE580|nr:probable RNA methyltransferase At5g51130 [Rhododendron vialii]